MMTWLAFCDKLYSAMEKKTLVCIKIWIEGESGETILGEGQFRMLEAIEKYGSISAAAKSMGMGYRTMWGRLRKLEQRTGTCLVMSEKGGARGGGSVLTSEGHELITRFRQLQSRIHDASMRIYREIY